jgi:hypothetical protein
VVVVSVSSVVVSVVRYAKIQVNVSAAKALVNVYIVKAEECARIVAVIRAVVSVVVLVKPWRY